MELPTTRTYGIDWSGAEITRLRDLQKSRAPGRFALKTWHDEDHSGIPGIGHPYWRDPLRINPVEQMNVLQTLNMPNDSSTFESLMHTLRHLPEQSHDGEYTLQPYRLEDIFQDEDQEWVAYLPVRNRAQSEQGIVPPDWETVFHGTRFHRLTGILQTGLQASERSHEVHGLWANRSAVNAMEWGSAPLERSRGVVIHMAAAPTAIRSNRRVRGTQKEKLVIQTEQGLNPPVCIQGIFVRALGPAYHEWLDNLETAMQQTASDWIEHQPTGHAYSPITLFHALRHHVRRRSDFIGMEGWRTVNFGAGADIVDTGISMMSLRITEVLQTLLTRNLDKKFFYMQKNPVEFLPQPMQKWFHTSYPQYTQWEQARSQGSFTPSKWPILGQYIPADRWDFDRTRNKRNCDCRQLAKLHVCQ
jgi:hypothetical protein